MIRFAEQPLTVGKIWRAGFGVYRATFAKVWHLAFILGVITSLMLFVVGMSPQSRSLLGHHVLAIVIGVLLLIALFLILFYFGLLLLDRIYRLIIAADDSLKNSHQRAVKKYWPCVLAVISAMLIAIGILLIVSLFFLAFSWLFHAKYWVATTLLVILAVPAICAFALAALVPTFVAPSILLDQASAWAAIKISWRLIWGNYWRIAAGFLLPLQIVLLPLIALRVFAMLHPDNLLLLYWYYVAYAIFGAFLIVPLKVSLILVQFNDLKLRRDMMRTWVSKK